MSNEIKVHIIFSDEEMSLIKEYAKEKFIPDEYVPFHLTKMLINSCGADMGKFMMRINGEESKEPKNPVSEYAVEVKQEDFLRSKPNKSARKKDRVRPASIISDAQTDEGTVPEMTVDKGTKIEELGLTVRSVNALKKRHNVFYAEDLAKLSEDDIYNTRGLGKKSFKEIFSARESILVRGKDGLVEESFDPADQDPVKRTFGIISKIDEIERDIDGFRDLKKIYQEVTALDNEQVKQVMLKNGFKPSAQTNVENLFESLLSCFPAQGEQIQQIYDLTSSLGESKFIAENERPTAFCGKKLFQMNLLEAEGLINELELEVKGSENQEPPANPFNSEPEDLF